MIRITSGKLRTLGRGCDKMEAARCGMSLQDAPVAKEGFCVTHFLTVKDQTRWREFYTRVLGGRVVKLENPCYIKLSNAIPPFSHVLFW